MELIEVLARFNIEGQMVPESFTLKGVSYKVFSTGRKWIDAEGQHFLVMTAGERVVELVFAPDVMRWYLKPIPGGAFSVSVA